MADTPDRRWERGTIDAVDGGPTERNGADGRRDGFDATLPQSPMARSLEVRVPARFEELSELGRGGMGRVFEARDHKLGRVVAVKQALSNDASILERFDREVKIAARLQHPNLITLLDAGRDEAGRPYYAMNKIDGTSLDRLIASSDLRGRLALVAQVAGVVEGAAYAHAQGVIHRDIKPSNILVGAYGETLLIDWGIARVLDETPELTLERESTGDLTRLGTTLGTPGFMPPEQARGEPANRASDVYALGVTLYNVLTGERPFAKLSATESIEASAAERGLDFTRIPADVPRDLVTIVRKATAPRAHDRYADGGALSRDLRAFLGGQLVPTHEYNLRERLARFVSRYRFAVTFGLLALIAIAIVSTISLRGVLSARRSAERAQANAEARLGDLIANLATAAPDVALAMLSSLPPESPAWANAHDIVTTALTAGAGRGIALGTSFAVPRPSPDGTAIVVIEAGWQSVRILSPDLRGPSTRLALDTPINEVHWLADGGALLGLTKERGLIRIDRATGASTPLDTGRKPVAIVETGDRVVVLAERTLLLVDQRGRPPTELAADVLVASRLATALVYATPAGVYVLPDGGTAQALEPTSTPWLVVRPDGQRVAYVVNGELVDRGLAADGSLTERGRWTVPGTFEMAVYCGDLVLGTVDRDMLAFETGQPPRRTALPNPDIAPAWRPGGLVYVNSERVEWTAGDTSLVLLQTAAPLQRIDLVGNHLLGIDRAGTMRSWSLDRLLDLHALPPGTREVAGLTDTYILTRSWGSTATYGRTSFTGGPSTVVEDRADPDMTASPLLFCEQAGRWLRLRPEAAWRDADTLVELGGQAPRDLGIRLRAAIACDIPNDRFAILTSEGLEVRQRSEPQVVRQRLSAPGAAAAAYAGGRFLVYGPDHALTLYSEAGVRLRSRPGALAPFALARDGSVAILEDNQVVIWSDAGTRTIDLGLDATVKLGSVDALEAGIVIRGTTNTFASDNTLVIIVRPDGTISRLGNAGGIAGTVADITETHVLTRRASGDVAITDIRTGSTIRFALRGFDVVRLTPSGDRAIAISHARGLMRVLRLDEAPRDPVALRAFVQDQANARIDRGTAFASFPSE